MQLCQMGRDHPLKTCFREDGSINKPVLCISVVGVLTPYPRSPMTRARVPCGWEGGGFGRGPSRPTSVVVSPWTLPLLRVHLVAALPKQFTAGLGLLSGVGMLEDGSGRAASQLGRCGLQAANWSGALGQCPAQGSARGALTCGHPGRPVSRGPGCCIQIPAVHRQLGVPGQGAPPASGGDLQLQEDGGEVSGCVQPTIPCPPSPHLWLLATCALQTAEAWALPTYLWAVRASSQRNKELPPPPGLPEPRGDYSALPLTGASAALKSHPAQSSLIAWVGVELMGIPQAAFGC